MAPIPIVLCGKHPDMCDNSIKGMLPEYDGMPARIKAALQQLMHCSGPRMP